ncbi:hypothetical protein AB0L10_29150 [Streptomyces flaveolus]|uniref:hypothetical protein n=1 Tax=Streptomyces flaveolus TaxID=67297 RepID=UPI00342CC8EB
MVDRVIVECGLAPDRSPALWVRADGAWRWAMVLAKQVRADGAVHYQVTVDEHGDTTVRTRL